MRFRAVGHVVAHAGSQRESSTVGEFGLEFTFEAEQEMTFRAPMVRKVPGGVFEHAHAYVAEVPRAPMGNAGFACVFCPIHGAPVDDAERQVRDLHGG